MVKEALRMAAMAGNMKKVQALVASGADVEEQSAMGLTPMYSAAERGLQKWCSFLWRTVRRGAMLCSWL